MAKLPLARAGDSTEDRFRHHVLDALDKAAEGSGYIEGGWTDQDLPELFKAIDAQRERIEARRKEKR